MPQVDLIAECYVVAPRRAVAARVHQPAFWAQLWPELSLTVVEDRGERGIRWGVSGALAGSCEVWLEAYGDGVIVHCYLRTDPPGRPLAPRAARRATRRRQLQVARVLWSFKDALEGNRAAGVGRSSGSAFLPTSKP